MVRVEIILKWTFEMLIQILDVCHEQDEHHHQFT